MRRSRAALVFPGQGAFDMSSFRSGALRADLDFVLASIASSPLESPAADTARRLAAGLREQFPTTPAATSLFVFAASVANFVALEEWGVRPAVLVGHAFGEIAALVCAGAISLDRGAEIVVQRTAALVERGEAGAMMAVRTSLPTAEQLVATAAAGAAAVVAENSPSDVVIAGTIDGVKAVRAAAARDGISIASLKSPWALHHPHLMTAAATVLAERIGAIRAGVLQVKVFSPILDRYYTPFDDLGACLAAQLTGRVQFASAIRQLAGAGIGPFIECGPLAGIDSFIKRTIRETPLAAEDLLPQATPEREPDAVDRSVIHLAYPHFRSTLAPPTPAEI
jgi:acyl transferase domain-containing protein